MGDMGSGEGQTAWDRLHKLGTQSYSQPEDPSQSPAQWKTGLRSKHGSTPRGTPRDPNEPTETPRSSGSKRGTKQSNYATSKSNSTPVPPARQQTTSPRMQMLDKFDMIGVDSQLQQQVSLMSDEIEKLSMRHGDYGRVHSRSPDSLSVRSSMTMESSDSRVPWMGPSSGNGGRRSDRRAAGDRKQSTNYFDIYKGTEKNNVVRSVNEAWMDSLRNSEEERSLLASKRSSSRISLYSDRSRLSDYEDDEARSKSATTKAMEVKFLQIQDSFKSDKQGRNDADHLRSQVADLLMICEVLISQRNDSISRRRAATSEVNRLQNEMDTLEKENARMKSEMEELQDENDELQLDNDQLVKQLNTAIEAAMDSRPAQENFRGEENGSPEPSGESENGTPEQHNHRPKAQKALLGSLMEEEDGDA